MISADELMSYNITWRVENRERTLENERYENYERKKWIVCRFYPVQIKFSRTRREFAHEFIYFVVRIGRAWSVRKSDPLLHFSFFYYCRNSKIGLLQRHCRFFVQSCASWKSYLACWLSFNSHLPGQKIISSISIFPYFSSQKIITASIILWIFISVRIN